MGAGVCDKSSARAMTSRWQPKAKPSYLKELLTHRYSLYGLLGSVATATFMSIPFGLGPALIPVLGYATATALAALFVPGSRGFRAWVDRKKSVEAREAARQHLVNELLARVGATHPLWKSYEKLLERRDSLRKLAEASETAISRAEIERLDDATIDFLGLWLGRTAIAERQKTLGEGAIRERIAGIDMQLERTEREEDRRRLYKARSELEELVTRRGEMRTREAAAEAAMMSLADTFDEIYQRVIANPSSRDDDLRTAVDRMNIEEELDHVLYEEVEAMLDPSKASAKTAVE